MPRCLRSWPTASGRSIRLHVRAHTLLMCIRLMFQFFTLEFTNHEVVTGISRRAARDTPSQGNRGLSCSIPTGSPIGSTNTGARDFQCCNLTLAEAFAAGGKHLPL